MRLGVDVLETDVRLTNDNHLVLFHDEDLMRMTGYEGTVRDHSLRELLEMELGRDYTPDGTTYPYRGRGETIVTLERAFEEFPDMRFNIDIKDPEREAVDILVDMLERHDRKSTVIAGSFHDHQIARLRKIAPDVATAAHPGEVTRFVFALKMHAASIFARNMCCAAFQVPVKYKRIRIIDRRFIRAAHDRGIAVHVWTINDRPTMEWLIDLGVDGIFTDRPGLLKETLKDRGLLM